MNSSEYSAIVQCEETLKSVLSQNPALAADCIAKRAKCLSPIDQLDAYDTDLSAYTRSCNLVEVVKKMVQYSNNPRYLFEELLKALKDCGNWTEHVIRLLRMSRNSKLLTVVAVNIRVQTHCHLMSVTIFLSATHV